MSKLRELILGNFAMKLLSLTIAVILWFVTMNVNNPTIEKDITVPLSFKNEALIVDKNFAIVNIDDLKNTTIQVKYKGKRNDVESIRKYKDAITATIDFSAIDLTNEALLGQEVAVPITVASNYPQVFTIVGYFPMTVLVNVDSLATKTVPVYTNIEGQPKDSYVLQGSPSLSKTSLSIKGPKSSLDKITKAVVTLSVEGADSDLTKSLRPVAMDNDSNNLSIYVYEGLDEITVTQKIAKATTVEILAPSLIGELPEGYYLVDYVTDIIQVDVLANEANENLSFNPIVLDSISLDSITESTEFKEDITAKLAEQGLKAKDETQCIVTTTINVDKESTGIVVVPIDQVIFTNASYDYIVEEEEITLHVQAPKSILDTLTPQDFTINCTLNTEAVPKEYTSNLEVTAPANVTLLDNPIVHIKVYSKGDI